MDESERKTRRTVALFCLIIFMTLVLIFFAGMFLGRNQGYSIAYQECQMFLEDKIILIK